MNTYSSQAKTLPLTTCYGCAAELQCTDKFCRRCGANQQDSGTRAYYANKATVLLNDCGGDLDTDDLLTPDDPWHYETTPLPAAPIPVNPAANLSLAALRAYHKVSGSLVQQIAANFSHRLLSQTRNLLMQRTVLALVSIPIWLLIVLLSPLDAYAAAKSVTRQI